MSAKVPLSLLNVFIDLSVSNINKTQFFTVYKDNKHNCATALQQFIHGSFPNFFQREYDKRKMGLNYHTKGKTNKKKFKKCMADSAEANKKDQSMRKPNSQPSELSGRQGEPNSLIERLFLGCFSYKKGKYAGVRQEAVCRPGSQQWTSRKSARESRPAALCVFSALWPWWVTSLNSRVG